MAKGPHIYSLLLACLRKYLGSRLIKSSMFHFIIFQTFSTKSSKAGDFVSFSPLMHPVILKCCRQWAINKRCRFPTPLDAGRRKVRVLAGLVSGESSPLGLQVPAS